VAARSTAEVENVPALEVQQLEDSAHLVGGGGDSILREEKRFESLPERFVFIPFSHRHIVNHNLRSVVYSIDSRREHISGTTASAIVRRDDNGGAGSTTRGKTSMTETTTFKACPCCGRRWPTRESFLEDAALEIIGYQVNFRFLELGLFLFNHHECRTTLSVRADEFLDLYQGPVFEDRKTGSSECPGHCLHADELSRCPAACECAFVREVLQLVRRRQEPSIAAG